MVELMEMFLFNFPYSTDTSCASCSIVTRPEDYTSSLRPTSTAIASDQSKCAEQRNGVVYQGTNEIVDFENSNNS